MVTNQGPPLAPKSPRNGTRNWSKIACVDQSTSEWTWERVLAPIGPHLGSIWLWGSYGPHLAPPVPQRAPLGLGWAPCGRRWSPLGSHVDPIGLYLDPAGLHLDPICAPLGSFWGRLSPIRAPIIPSHHVMACHHSSCNDIMS